MKISNGRPYPLGSNHDGGGTNFSVFSTIAQRIEVCFFDDDNREHRFELPAKTGSIWHGYFESIEPPQRYGFRVHGPWNPSEGHLCSPQKLLLDPYAKAVDGDVTWEDSLFPLNPENPSDPPNDVDTAPFMPKSVVVDTVFDWRNGGPLRTRLEDTVIYELHVKGFTVGHPNIPPEVRGTYAGLAHPASIEHLKRLGVTAVELLPVCQFVHRRRLTERGLRNFWGYDPICLMAPHNEYASDRRPGGAVNEFKEMVRALHAVGIEVILDIVFNHTAEGGANGPILGLKGFDNTTYYRLSPRDRLEYIDHTGTQNTLRTNHPPVRQLIIDCLRYWATEMQIDGFRLDLAPVLAREDGSMNFQNAFFTTVRRDPVLSRTKLIAEPWDVGEGGYQLGRFPAEWSEWNDRYRDDVRDFWKGRNGSARQFAARFAGSPDIFGSADRMPQAGVNMITCHDGFTLHDLVSHEKKHNEANGEENQDGHNDNHSWNCGVEGSTDDSEINSLRARQKRNFLATLLLSHGIPMILGGDEMGRTQRGNNNAYCQDNEISWLDWVGADHELTDCVAFLIGFRKRHETTRQRVWPGKDGAAKAPLTHTWYDVDGRRVRPGNLENAEPKPLQVVVSAGFEDEANGLKTEKADDILIMFNPTRVKAVFKTPPSGYRGPWYAVVDTTSPFPVDPQRTTRAGETFTSMSHSLVVWTRRV